MAELIINGREALKEWVLEWEITFLMYWEHRYL